MEGPPQLPTQEQNEYIPTREEILLTIGKFCENPQIVKELKDEKGIYLLRAEVPSTKPGETLDYTYQREGSFGNMSSDVTRIFLTHMQDGEVIWAEDKTRYNPQTKGWE